jgi:tetratricopeptide (TPR) repeat protein
MAWSLRGFLRFNKGNFAAAQTDAERALELDPQCFEAMGVRGMARLGQSMVAIQGARLGGTDLPLDDGAHEAAWLVNYVEGSVDIQRYFGHAQERPEFRDLKRLTPELDRMLKDLKAKDGKTVITEVVSRKFVDRARALAKADDGDCALEILNRAVALDDKNAAAYALRGDLQFSTEHFGEAVKDFEKAIELDPSLEKALKSKLEEARKKAGG